ncbi:MAG: YdcH family protein [Steroidobacteraceae bacterium]
MSDQEEPTTDPTEAQANVDTQTFKRLERLRELRIEHRDLDDVINRLQMDLYVNEVQLRRLKKRKLMVKDQITRMESELIPDLNA